MALSIYVKTSCLSEEEFMSLRSIYYDFSSFSTTISVSPYPFLPDHFSFPVSLLYDLNEIIGSAFINSGYVRPFLIRQLIVKLELILKCVIIGRSADMLDYYALLSNSMFSLIEIYNSLQSR